MAVKAAAVEGGPRTREFIKKARDNGTLRIALAVVALGILLGSTWASRGCTVFGTENFASLAMVCAIAVALATPLFPRDRLERSGLATGLVFAGIHLACMVFSPLLTEPSELTALGIVAAAFEGCAFGLLQVLALRAIFDGGSQAPAAIATSFLLANLYDTPFIAAPGAAVAAQWAIGPLACVGLLMVAKRLSNPVTETSGSAEHGRENPGATSRLLAPFLVAVAIFMLVQGVFAYVTGLGGTGSHAFFDRSNAILVIGVRVVLLVVCLTIPAALTPTRTLGAAMVLWAVGIATTASFWENPGNAVGPLVLEAGLYTLQVMALSTTCRIGQTHGIASLAILGPAVAAITANQITRHFAGLFFEGMPGFYAMAVLAMGTLVVVVLVGAAALFVREVRGGALENGLGSVAPSTNPTALPSASANAAVQDELGFQRRIEEFCETYKIPERERQVLALAMRGHTIDATAERLGLSRETVKTYLSRSYNRAGVGSRQAIREMIERFEG